MIVNYINQIFYDTAIFPDATKAKFWLLHQQSDGTLLSLIDISNTIYVQHSNKIEIIVMFVEIGIRIVLFRHEFDQRTFPKLLSLQNIRLYRGENVSLPNSLQI